jgi:hypothetical protein
MKRCNVCVMTLRHVWVENTLWNRPALVCSACQLHIIDFPMPPMYREGGFLHVVTSGEVPTGKTLLRPQTSNVLKYDFSDKTREEIIAYAEDEHNRVCEGEPYARWQPFEPAVKPVGRASQPSPKVTSSRSGSSSGRRSGSRRTDRG